MHNMKRNILFGLIAAFALVGCMSDNVDYVEYDGYDAYLSDLGCGTNNPNGRTCAVRDAQTGAVKQIRYSTPHGNDLVLETPEYIVHIDGVPNKKYGYYVWTGVRDYTDAPDLIVRDGAAAILVEE